MSNRYIAHLEKQSSLIAGAAVTHLAQNAAVKAALSNKSVGKYVGHSFNEGVHGVVDKSIGGYAKRIGAAALTPEIGSLHSELHHLGKKMAPHLEGMSLKQRAVLHSAVSKGKIPSRYSEFAKDPKVLGAYGIAQQHAKKQGMNLPSLSNLASKQNGLSKLWQDKDHPLLSNIAKNVGSGKVNASKFKKGTLSAKEGFVGSAIAGVAEPSAGLLDGLKAAVSSKKFTDSKIGGKITKMLNDKFVKAPIKKGFEHPNAYTNKLKNTASDIVSNPLVGNLQRASSAISGALDPVKPPVAKAVSTFSKVKTSVSNFMTKLKAKKEEVLGRVGGGHHL